jgi:hypothetical protein
VVWQSGAKLIIRVVGFVNKFGNKGVFSPPFSAFLLINSRKFIHPCVDVFELKLEFSLG